MEAGTSQIHLANIDLEKILRFAVTTVLPAAAAGSVEVEVSCGQGPPMRGDADRIEQLFENLLSNAVKFTPARGKVTVRAIPRYDAWMVEIADTGIGIPRAEQQMLYNRFSRGSNIGRAGIGGNRLGLSIARAIVDMHGGTLSIRSKVGLGTTVTVHLRSEPSSRSNEGLSPGAAIDRTSE